MHKICRLYVIRNTEMFLACSKLAGEWMFGKKNTDSQKYKTIFNGVEVEKYLYNESIRKQYRENLGFGDSFIIANIGRFSYQKNQSFLVEVFSRFHQTFPNSKLVFVGSGELETSIKEKVNALGLNEKVIFLGLRKDVYCLLSAFDVMVMPSRFEGLPVTMVEAQMASLPCVVSANITDEAKFTKNVEYVEGWEICRWVKLIKQTSMVKRPYDKDCLINSIFNTVNASLELQNILTGEYK